MDSCKIVGQCFVDGLMHNKAENSTADKLIDSRFFNRFQDFATSLVQGKAAIYISKIIKGENDMEIAWRASFALGREFEGTCSRSSPWYVLFRRRGTSPSSLHFSNARLNSTQPNPSKGNLTNLGCYALKIHDNNDLAGTLSFFSQSRR